MGSLLFIAKSSLYEAEKNIPSSLMLLQHKFDLTIDFEDINFYATIIFSQHIYALL